MEEITFAETRGIVVWKRKCAFPMCAQQLRLSQVVSMLSLISGVRVYGDSCNEKTCSSHVCTHMVSPFVLCTHTYCLIVVRHNKPSSNPPFPTQTYPPPHTHTPTIAT